MKIVLSCNLGKQKKYHQFFLSAELAQRVVKATVHLQYLVWQYVVYGHQIFCLYLITIAKLFSFYGNFLIKQKYGVKKEW